ncbi:MAG TPA: hypothetical protein VNL39_00215 [Xanthobacteraceae bacterium]|nr:hypothetical protein [Xanthobacteraceae bacterium]
MAAKLSLDDFSGRFLMYVNGKSIWQRLGNLSARMSNRIAPLEAGSKRGFQGYRRPY